MLLRLRVQGFKNLHDVDVRFGPLTCFVGPNGVGKSNLFDALQFLRHLADHEIDRAAELIRPSPDGDSRALDLLADRDPSATMRFAADMLVPLAAEDDFGQQVEPSASLLSYTVAFRYSTELGRLALAEEELVHLKKGDARQHLLFPHAPSFRDSVLRAHRFGTAFLSTSTGDGGTCVQLHGDGGSRSRPVPASRSPRTILGGTGSKEYPTIVAARREMASWHSVHLDPPSLRTPDRFGENAPVDERGRHIAATLRRLARGRSPATSRAAPDPAALEQVCATAAEQLARLVDGVAAVRVRDDEVRQRHVVEVRFRDADLWMPPRAQSDGTLRCLALVAMQMDAQSSRVLCLEEPENGIEPDGVPALMRLLRDYAVDAQRPVDAERNPLRQVILNSHSPEVVKQLDAAEVLFVESAQGPGGRQARVRPVAYTDTWRPDQDCVSHTDFERWVGGLPRGQTRIA